MRTNLKRILFVLVAANATGLVACGESRSSGSSGGSGSSTGGSSGSTGGSSTATGGSDTSVSGAGASPTSIGSGGNAGTASGGAGPSSGGASTGTGGGAACTVGAWPAADPALAGPFATVTENNVGPAVGVGASAGAGGSAPVAFTMFRPKDLGQGGLCHPAITWGNGTGSTPSLYKVLLNHLASHGFVVIASDSPNVAQGTPPPMVAGVTWLLQQNDDPSSELFQKIDTAHVGATGHSQGGFATTTAGADSHITTVAPLCGASSQRNLHGPAWLFCGGMDTTVPCSTIQNAFTAIGNVPVMQASYLSADHANWLSFRGTKPAPVEVAVTAWMRVQLMGDTALRSWFYGDSCKLCTDPAWQVTQKMMPQ